MLMIWKLWCASCRPACWMVGTCAEWIPLVLLCRASMHCLICKRTILSPCIVVVLQGKKNMGSSSASFKIFKSTGTSSSSVATEMLGKYFHISSSGVLNMLWRWCKEPRFLRLMPSLAYCGATCLCASIDVLEVGRHTCPCNHGSYLSTWT